MPFKVLQNLMGLPALINILIIIVIIEFLVNILKLYTC